MYEHGNGNEQRCNDGDALNRGADYMGAAHEAYDSGDHVLAMHLFLTAYEQESKGSHLPDPFAVDALREAWSIACELGERSIAEYVFDKLEPVLDEGEAKAFGRKLQSLAFEKLSEFGISQEDLAEMAELITEEIGPEAAAAFAPDASDEPSAADAAEDGSKPVASDAGAKAKIVSVRLPKASADAASAGHADANRLTFSDLTGYDTVIEDTRALGIGLGGDEELRALIDTLRVQHGLEKLSAFGSVVFRTSSREDAGYFMAAVVGELGLPAMRVQMQPGPQGMPVLCVAVSSDRRGKAASGRMMLDAPSVLVLEDIDLWGVPLMQAATADDSQGILAASMTRAAREALTLIRSAVEHPEIHVLVSMGGESDDQGYLYDMLEPMNIVDIYLPDEIDRKQIWKRIADEHPSVRKLNLTALTRLSRNVSRYDIALAAREAVEEAYRQSLAARRYVPVSQSLMYEHLAAFQPLDSEEYRILEDAVASAFAATIDADLDAFETESAQLGIVSDELPDAEDAGVVHGTEGEQGGTQPSQ